MENKTLYDIDDLFLQMPDEDYYLDKTDDEKIKIFLNHIPRLVKRKGVNVFDNFDRFTDEVSIETDFININRIEEFTNYKNNINYLIDKSLKRYLENRTENKDSIFLKLKTLVKNEKIEGVSLLFYTLKIDLFENLSRWDKLYILNSNNKIIGDEVKRDMLYGKFNYEGYQYDEREEVNVAIVYTEYFLNLSDYSKLIESNSVEFSLRSKEQENIKIDFLIYEDSSKVFSSFHQKLNQYSSLTTKPKFELVTYSFELLADLISFEMYINLLECEIEDPAKKAEFLKKTDAWLEKNSNPEVWVKYNSEQKINLRNNIGDREISNKSEIGNKSSSGLDVDTLKKLIEAEQFTDAKNYIKEKTGKSALDIKITLAEYAEKFGKSEKYKKYEKKMDIVGYSILIGIVLFLIWIFT